MGCSALEAMTPPRLENTTENSEDERTNESVFLFTGYICLFIGETLPRDSILSVPSFFKSLLIMTLTN